MVVVEMARLAMGVASKDEYAARRKVRGEFLDNGFDSGTVFEGINLGRFLRRDIGGSTPRLFCTHNGRSLFPYLCNGGGARRERYGEIFDAEFGVGEAFGFVHRWTTPLFAGVPRACGVAAAPATNHRKPAS